MSKNLTIAEIQKHNTDSDFWLVMGENVYEFKDYSHPGGQSEVQPYYGGLKDATHHFEHEHGKPDGITS